MRPGLRCLVRPRRSARTALNGAAWSLYARPAQFEAHTANQSLIFLIDHQINECVERVERVNDTPDTCVESPL